MTAIPAVRGEIMLDGRRLETAWWGADPRDGTQDGTRDGTRDGPGARPTIVLLHEGLGCIDLWRDVPATLAAWTGCPVFAWSRFGYGQSDPAPLPWPMTYMQQEALDILPRVLNAAGVGRHILVGHSDGGSIAAIHAGGVADERLIGLVTIAAHFFVEPINIAAIERIRSTYTEGDLRDRLARYHRDVDPTFFGWNDAWLDPRFRDFDITAYLPDIRAPILGLQGADDPYGTAAQLDALTDHARVQVRTHLIQDARHAPHLEARNETLATITGFILDLPP